MKFCRYCGKQLEDNAVCDCQAAVNAANQASANSNVNESINTNESAGVNANVNAAGVNSSANVNNAQPVNFNQSNAFQGQYAQPQPPVNNPSPYVINSVPQPKTESKAAKAFKNLPVVFTSFWKDSKNVTQIAKNSRDYAVSIIYTVIFFIAVFLGNIFVFLAMNNNVKSLFSTIGGSYGSAAWSYLGGFFNFPKILLTSVIMTVLIAGLYILVLFVSNKIFVKGTNAKKCFSDAFISFAINSIPASMGIILFGLSAFVNIYLAFAFLAFSGLYLIVNLVVEIKDTAVNVTSKTKFVMLSTLFICVAFLIVAVAGIYLFVWCLNINDMLRNIGSLSSSSGISGFLNRLY